MIGFDLVPQVAQQYAERLNVRAFIIGPGRLAG
jgi:hypothetical protein